MHSLESIYVVDHKKKVHVFSLVAGAIGSEGPA